MTRLFWELYLPVLAILGGVGILTGVISGVVERAWRRWRCRREMEQQEVERRHCYLCHTVTSPHPHHAIPSTSTPDETLIVNGGTGYRFSRRDLENLATARDKAERKIH